MALVFAMEMERRTVDLAQATALLLVILYHINDLTIGFGESHWRLWYIYNVAEPVLMPFFFFLAGGSAGRVLTLKSKKVSRNRIAAYLWLYFLWTSFYIVYGFFLATYSIPQLTRCSDNPGVCYAIPVNPLWFIHHLIIFLTLSYFFPPNGVILLTALSAIQTVIFYFVGWYINRILASLAFFILGFYYLRPMYVFIVRASLRRVGMFWITYFFGVICFYKMPALNIPVFHEVLSLIGIILLLKSAELFVRNLPIASFIHIGRHMLPIYLLHWVAIFPIVLIYHKIYRYAAFAGREKTVVQIFGPFVLLAATVFVSLIIYRCTRRIHGLYVPNKAVVRQISEISLSFRNKCRSMLSPGSTKY